jgi:transcriptional regulator
MSNKRVGVLRGTVDLLILRTLELEPKHGVAIAERIEQLTRGEFSLSPGSLFPALHRLEQQGWLRSEWDATEEGRRARFYRLTPSGRAQLRREKHDWARIVTAMQQVLESE